MSSLVEHQQDCIRLLGRPWTKVHIWLDAKFAQHGEMHRHCRHHSEGIEVIRQRWGPEAASAAERHVIMDCGHIPNAQDYEAGTVDYLGRQKQ
ncbi:MAG TPA: hypothetical protein ENJ42_10095 [Hellea balneolensis]|uniref:DUF6915 domain-containing protein n=1 Tax=Hellea balneolensis TaxID=287478 RepID=A0A7C5QT36_9PROT|nr:hypothetical protein [Hellea balneolensis]